MRIKYLTAAVAGLAVVGISLAAAAQKPAATAKTATTSAVVVYKTPT